jgi:FKBP-type peptidyl-prolyl cis-trans isomerase
MKKLHLFLMTLMIASGLFSQAAPPPAGEAPAEASPQDIDYAFGLLMGQNLATTGLTFDPQQLLEGLQDSLSPGKKPRFDADRAKQIVTQAVHAAQQKANTARIKKEEDYLSEHAKKDGVVTTGSGLQIEVLQKGTGVKPRATDTVKVNYVGTLIDGTEFDSSVKRGQPAVFTLGQVIPGWTEGIQLMAVGGKYRLTIPSSLAYGARGAGGVIPPFATLVFEVELVSIETPSASIAPDPAVPDAPAPAK